MPFMLVSTARQVPSTNSTPHVHTGDPGIVDLDLGMRVAADGGHPGPR
jgi:hypothetical protein